MFLWKLAPVLAAEHGVDNVIDKARRARLSAIWVKVAEGGLPYANVTGPLAGEMTALVTRAHARGLQVCGWHVPHCPDIPAARAEAAVFGDLADRFALDGLIVDAEGTAGFFRGGIAEARAYATAVRDAAESLGKPLGVSGSSNPRDLAGWLPKFDEIATRADWNFAQTYYGASPSVAACIDAAAAAYAHIAAPFVPVGAGFIGPSEGGCASAELCGERAATFIQLCKERGYQGYAFWHWGGAPPALWDVLNATPP